MARNIKEAIQWVGRQTKIRGGRLFLGGLVATTVATASEAVNNGDVAAVTQAPTQATREFFGSVFGAGRVRAEGQLPTEIGENIEYIPEAAETVILKGETTFLTPMKRKDIQVIVSQELTIAGNRYSVDPTRNPEKTMVVVVGALTDVNLQFTGHPGVTIWKGRERTKRENLGQQVEDLVRAGEVQVTRTRIPGNCTPDGCQATRLIVIGAHAGGFNLIADQELSR